MSWRRCVWKDGEKKRLRKSMTRRGFKYFLFSPFFTPKWFNLTCAYFSDGLVQPPTRWRLAWCVTDCSHSNLRPSIPFGGSRIEPCRHGFLWACPDLLSVILAALTANAFAQLINAFRGWLPHHKPTQVEKHRLLPWHTQQSQQDSMTYPNQISSIFIIAPLELIG